MTTPDLTRAEREDLVKWMRSGFRQYAAQCDNWGFEIEQNIRVQIFKYGNEFARILRGKIEMSEEDDPQALRTDLYGLKESGCPAVGLVELMLACTSDYGVTISDLLWRAEFLSEQMICQDNLGFSDEPQPGFKIGKIKVGRLPRVVKRGVPLSIQFMQARMSKRVQARRARYQLALFYLFLKHFRYDHDTLTRILSTMQYVRHRVPPVADYLKTKGKLKFNAVALQRKVHRFVNSDPRNELALKKQISVYISHKKSEFF
jgi:hypothetical protein